MPVVDMAAAAVVAIAVLRGFWIGLVRELFSIAALAAACFAVRAFTQPVGEQIAIAAKINPLAGQAAGGAVVAVATIVVIALIGYGIRRSVRFAGLGFVDRIGGGVLGAAEGAVMVALGVFIATLVLGRTDPLLAGSSSLTALDAVETWVTGKPPAQAHAEGTAGKPVAPAKR